MTPSAATVGVAALVVAIGCSTPSPPSPSTRPAAKADDEAPPIDAAVIDTSELDAYFRAQFPEDSPGIAVLVAKRGRTVFSAGYGLADLTTRAPITTSTLFNLGSLSKTFVANAILILQERGKLSVDDPLSKYFPDFKHPELASRVRIRHLLTHTSGLPDNRPVETQPEFFLTARDAENWHPLTQADALSFDPGSRFEYSNPAFNGLALIVEKVSGRPWQDFVRDEIFVPAGMSTSTITNGPHPESGVSHGYMRIFGVWTERDYGEVPTFAAAGNGGVWSSVDELALYETALREGRFLRPATVADSRTIKTFPNWASDEAPRIGWAWFVRELDGVRQIGHNGSQGGFLTHYATLPDKDLLVVFLSNATMDFDAVRAELLRWLRQRNWLD